MKKIIIALASITLCIGLVITVYANKNENAAKKYCEEQKAKGLECKVSAWVGCGAGWEKDKEFRGKGKDYFACKRTRTHERYERKSEAHKEECEEFCKRNPDCEKCKEGNVCGVGYKIGKKFSGPGRNWVACFQSAYGEESERNKKSCERWCKSHSCAKCSELPNCGVGFRTGKTFGGKGKNWYACFHDATR
jgi:hypothetical protein